MERFSLLEGIGKVKIWGSGEAKGILVIDRLDFEDLIRSKIVEYRLTQMYARKVDIPFFYKAINKGLVAGLTVRFFISNGKLARLVQGIIGMDIEPTEERPMLNTEEVIFYLRLKEDLDDKVIENLVKELDEKRYKGFPFQNMLMVVNEYIDVYVMKIRNR